ncbi:MAG: F0F1-type ATP synthase delta subunit [Candidatus Paceibacteria bacterium]|jgi:F0F1-type ATP synthase delta subunit
MINSRDIVQTLLFANKKSDIDAKKLVSNTLAYLKKQNLEHLLPEVLRILEQEGLKEAEQESVVIETARVVSESTLKQIAEKLLTGAKENPEQIVNEDLIGGFVVKHDGVIYDASLKRKMELLKTKLIK